MSQEHVMGNIFLIVFRIRQKTNRKENKKV